MAERKMPGWLRVLFNVAALFGVVATLMGWVSHPLGVGIMVIAAVYVLWEIAPWITNQIANRPIWSLVGF
jgi:hypothetical protein